MDKLNLAELGYLAGIIDGEGWIGLGKTNENYYTPCIEIGNTNSDLLFWLKNKINFGTVRFCSERKNKKEAWTFRIIVKSQIKVLKAILPYLVVKKLKAELLLEYHLLSTFVGTNVPEEILVKRMVIYDELKALNRKGPNGN